MIETEPLTLLGLPPELRNLIYNEVFTDPALTYSISCEDTESTSFRPMRLEDFGKDQTYLNLAGTHPNNNSLLLTNRQLHSETHRLYFSTTVFHLNGTATDPHVFETLSCHIPERHLAEVRNIVLTSKLGHLRALNEQWCGIPFGSRALYLDTLALVPRRPDTHSSAYAEVSDMSQSYTLAYILSETLKTLRNVRRVVVRNEGCFSTIMWRLVYRNLVYRLWKWGGRLCELGFREWEADGITGFEVLCKFQREHGQEQDGWRDALQEVNRLIGSEGGAISVREGD